MAGGRAGCGTAPVFGRDNGLVSGLRWVGGGRVAEGRAGLSRSVMGAGWMLVMC